MRSIALVLAMMATPAVAADQFDLVCKGGRNTTVRYRVDLAKGEYCATKCENVAKIAEVTSGFITLYDNKPSLPNATTSYSRINRNTGEWAWYFHSAPLRAHQDVKGTCEVAPFTAFPKARF